MSLFLFFFTDIICSPEERMNKSPSAPWLWLHDYIITLISWMHYSEKPPLRAKQTNTPQYVPPPLGAPPTSWRFLSSRSFNQSVTPSAQTTHIQPASSNLEPLPVFLLLIYIFMFYFRTAVARTPEAWKALPSDSRRKWTINVILHYVGGKRWSWEPEGRKTSVRLFLSVWGHGARPRADTCRRSVCLQVCEEPLSVTPPYVCFLWSQSHSSRGKVHHGTWLQKINKQTAAERGAK